MKRLLLLAFCACVLAPPPASTQTRAGLGVLMISYTFFHLPRIASNQLAVWIEDSQGAFVTTVFATDFMARRKGYIKRPQTCPEWVKTSGLAGMPDAAIDVISGATQRPGRVELTWDCIDGNGTPVPPGIYRYKVEGNISWEKRVLWEGRIEISSKPSTSVADPTYIPDSARTAGMLLTEVGATFRPSR